MPQAAFSRARRPAYAVATVLLVGALTAAAAPPEPVADAASAFKTVGVAGLGLLPRVVVETTVLHPCNVQARCVVGPFPPADRVTFGIIPVYEGAVTMSVAASGGLAPVFTCQVPGPCQVLGTGAVGSSFRVIGDAAAGSVGQYVVWVSYGD